MVTVTTKEKQEKRTQKLRGFWEECLDVVAEEVPILWLLRFIEGLDVEGELLLMFVALNSNEGFGSPIEYK